MPTVDGKRVALREFLVFDERIRDILLEGNPEDVTSATRRLVREHGQLMTTDAHEKFKDGIISERIYKIITAGTKHVDDKS